jgi:hypothetical protein
MVSGHMALWSNQRKRFQLQFSRSTLVQLGLWITQNFTETFVSKRLTHNIWIAVFWFTLPWIVRSEHGSSPTLAIFKHLKIQGNASMTKRNRALGAPMTITQKQVVQSYGDWIVDYLNCSQTADLLTHLAQRMSRSPGWTKEQATQWVDDYYDLEWTPYHVTFMFHHIPGSEEEKIRQMHKDIGRFYGKLASWVVRDPKSSKYAHLLPRGVFFPDVPCYKREKQALRDVTINDGLHFHGIILVRTKSRLKVPFLQHLRDKRKSYGRGSTLTTHAEPIRDHHRFVADYAGKGVKRGRVSYDDVLVLPRTGKELQENMGETIFGPDREIKDIMSANNVSIETAHDLYESARRCRKQSEMKRS